MENTGSISRPLYVGLVAGAIDMFVLREENMQRTAIFAGAVAAGSYASEYVGPLVHHIPVPSLSKNLYDGKTLITRIAEVASSAGMTYVVNKYLLNNDVYRNEMMMRLSTIAAADVIGTYLQEYMDSQPLHYLTK